MLGYLNSSKTLSSSTLPFLPRFSSKKAASKPGALIAPHGGELKCSLLEGAAKEDALKRARGLPRINISSRENGDLIMMGIGGFSPLNRHPTIFCFLLNTVRFMNRTDWKGVCEKFLLPDGTFWPIPITMSVDKATATTARRYSTINCTAPAYCTIKRSGVGIVVCTTEGDSGHYQGR